MLEITNLVTPSPEQFMAVIKGMRLPMKSGDRSDSKYCNNFGGYDDNCSNCLKYSEEEDMCYLDDGQHEFVIGDADKKLLFNLCSAGDPSHRKVLRQLPVIMDITAPLYFFKQLDTYKVGTVAQSESTMHTMTKYPFKVEDFSVENFLEIDGEETNWLQCSEYEDSDLWFDGMDNHGYCFTPEEYFQENLINLLNSLRHFYLKTNDPKYWFAINELLPQSYTQTRCWSGNYENLVTILKQRKGHKLSEWEQFRTYVLNNVPYLKEINEAVNESNN